MTPEDAARDSGLPIVQLPSYFMMDGATYQVGGELGFNGVDFYLAGRAGVLGDVASDVVAAALVFFNPDLIAEGWERCRPVMSRTEATERFAGCAHRWADHHLADGPDYARLAELSGRIASSASPACAPLFAGWRALAEPEGDKSLVVHRMNVLRELRGALHGAAVLASGLRPVEALSVKTPAMAALFGWSEPLPDADACRAQWQQAETMTNRMFGRTLESLDETERADFVELSQAALDAVT